jgi:hypothetical protein
MAGTEMKNAVLIALVVLVLLFVVHQYDPSFFGLLGSREGFADKPLKAGTPNAGASHGTNTAPPTGASPGMPQKLGNSVGNKNVNGQNQGMPGSVMNNQKPATAATPYTTQPNGAKKEGFADLSAYEGPANFGAAEAPAGCYPRDQLTPSELLPRDMNSIWAEQNPMGPGSLKGKNFLSAGALIGVNTVGQSLRNANLQIRSEPPNPQVPVSIFNQSTISPDISHRPLEVGP